MWRSFDTAPKNGKEILVFYPHQKVYKLVYFNDYHKYWYSKGEPATGIEHQEVVWHPLPEYNKGGIGGKS